MSSSDIAIGKRIILFMDVHNYSMTLDALAESRSFLQEMYENLGEMRCFAYSLSGTHNPSGLGREDARARLFSLVSEEAD